MCLYIALLCWRRSWILVVLKYNLSAPALFRCFDTIHTFILRRLNGRHQITWEKKKKEESISSSCTVSDQMYSFCYSCAFAFVACVCFVNSGLALAHCVGVREDGWKVTTPPKCLKTVGGSGRLAHRVCVLTDTVSLLAHTRFNINTQPTHTSLKVH